MEGDIGDQSNDVWHRIFAYCVHDATLPALNSQEYKEFHVEYYQNLVNDSEEVLIIKFLLDAGLSKYAIGVALGRGEVDFLKEIHKALKDDDCSVETKSNLLVQAVKQDHVVSMILLLFKKADSDFSFSGEKPGYPTEDTLSFYLGYNSLQTAAYRGHLYCLRYLLERGANPARLGEAKRTVVHIAVARRHREVVKFLVNEWAGLMKLANALKQYPLHLAAKHYDEVIFPLILNACEDVVNEQDEHSNTPAHLLVIHTDVTDALDLLEAHGAKFDIPNNKDKTVEDLLKKEIQHCRIM